MRATEIFSKLELVGTPPSGGGMTACTEGSREQLSKAVRSKEIVFVFMAYWPCGEIAPTCQPIRCNQESRRFQFELLIGVDDEMLPVVAMLLPLWP